jgi:transcriptional regulator with XRE-family HTH domain
VPGECSVDSTCAFAEALQRHRRARGLTQAELAEHAHLSVRASSDLERGLKHPQRASPGLGRVAAVAQAVDQRGRRGTCQSTING